MTKSMTVSLLIPPKDRLLLEHATSAYRPPEIRELQDVIEGEDRVNRLFMSVLGTLEMERVLRVAELKQELGRLHEGWKRGEIG